MNIIFNFIKRIHLSIFDLKSYKILIEEKLFRAILYLMLLCFTVGLVGSLKPIYDYNKLISYLFVKNQDKIPSYELNNGTLKLKYDKPIIIKDNEFITVIDPYNQKSVNTLKNYHSGVLVLRNKLIYKINDETRELKFRNDFNLSKEDIGASLIFKFRSFSLFIAIKTSLSIFIQTFIYALLLALVAIFFGGIRKYYIGYGDSLKISIYALTLPFILQMINVQVKLNDQLFMLAYFLIGIIYLIKGLNASQKYTSDLQEPRKR